MFFSVWVNQAGLNAKCVFVWVCARVCVCVCVCVLEREREREHVQFWHFYGSIIWGTFGLCRSALNLVWFAVFAILRPMRLYHRIGHKNRENHSFANLRFDFEILCGLWFWTLCGLRFLRFYDPYRIGHKRRENRSAVLHFNFEILCGLWFWTYAVYAIRFCGLILVPNRTCLVNVKEGTVYQMSKIWNSFIKRTSFFLQKNVYERL